MECEHGPSAYHLHARCSRCFRSLKCCFTSTETVGLLGGFGFASVPFWFRTSNAISVRVIAKIIPF